MSKPSGLFILVSCEGVILPLDSLLARNQSGKEPLEGRVRSWWITGLKWAKRYGRRLLDV